MTQLLLFSDRIELRRMGRCIRTVPLSQVEDIAFSGWPTAEVNLRIEVRGEASLSGRVEALLAWKYKLIELLGLEVPGRQKLDPRFRLASAA